MLGMELGAKVGQKYISVRHLLGICKIKGRGISPSLTVSWSERHDLNVRPLPPQGSNLTFCVTFKICCHRWLWEYPLYNAICCLMRNTKNIDKVCISDFKDLLGILLGILA